MVDFYLLAAGAVAVLGLTIYYTDPARTARELTLPFDGSALPRAEVRAALERMGCLVVDDEERAITGLLPGDGVVWGQDVRVTAERGHLRVRSAFSARQGFGASTNQENVNRFKIEWERRVEFEAAEADPEVREAAERKALEIARKAIWGGGLAVAGGMVFLLLAILLPSQGNNSSAGSRARLIGIALIPIAYGLPRVWAAVARLRK